MFGIDAGAVVSGGPEPAGGLVGQRHGGLVVAAWFGQRQCPLLGAIQRLAAFSGNGGYRHRAERAPWISKVTAFIRKRLGKLYTLIALVRDEGYGLPDENRQCMLACLT